MHAQRRMQVCVGNHALSHRAWFGCYRRGPLPSHFKPYRCVVNASVAEVKAVQELGLRDSIKKRSWDKMSSITCDDSPSGAVQVATPPECLPDVEGRHKSK